MTRPHFHIDEEPSPNVLNPWIPGESMTIAAAAKFIGQSEANVRRLAARFDLGRRISGPWMISRVAVLMFLEGNARALQLYHKGDRTSSEVLNFYKRCGLRMPKDVFGADRGPERANLTKPHESLEHRRWL